MAEAIWERLGIGKILREVCKRHGYGIPYEWAVFAMTANQLCAPRSKLGVWDRCLPRVYLPSCRGLKLDHFYEAMDVLHAHIGEDEETVFDHTVNLWF